MIHSRFQICPNLDISSCPIFWTWHPPDMHSKCGVLQKNVTSGCVYFSAWLAPLAAGLLVFVAPIVHEIVFHFHEVRSGCSDGHFMMV